MAGQLARRSQDLRRGGVGLGRRAGDERDVARDPLRALGGPLNIAGDLADRSSIAAAMVVEISFMCPIVWAMPPMAVAARSVSPWIAAEAVRGQSPA